jgi:hypothetical protein
MLIQNSSIKQITNYKHQIPNKSQIPISNDQNTLLPSERDGDFVLGATIESQFTDLKLCRLDNLGGLWINFRLIF